MRLADILVEMGAIERGQVDALLAENPAVSTPTEFAALLIEQAAVSENDLLAATAQVYGLDFVVRIEDEMLAADLIEKVPIAWARNHCVLPIRHAGEIGMLTSDPEANDAEKYLSLLLQQEVVPVLAPTNEIRRAIETCYVSRVGGHAELMADLEAEPSSPIKGARETETDLLSTVENAPVTQLVNLMLLEAVKSSASDIHIEPYEDRVQVRYRIDGILYQQPAPPKRLQEALISRLKVMARLDIAEKRLPQDGMAKVRAGERDIDIRVSTVPIADGERIVLRILNRQTILMPMEGLGMSPELLELSQGLLAEPQGIILVTGPTGSGKTTTLYSGLQQLDTEHLNVITIEDPIEYQLEGISQIQVKPRIGLGFADGLRHILRQDPDVILVGEIRDGETAEIAIRSSLTGHLVLSTIHTNDAASTPLRIIDMGIKPYLLSESLRAVIAQRLVRRLCPSCRAAAEWTAAEIELAPSGPAPAANQKPHYRAVGCDLCRAGYKGRIGLFEYLLVNDEVKTAIRKEADLRRLSELSAKYAMDTLRQDGLRKIHNGATSIDEVVRVLGRK